MEVAALGERKKTDACAGTLTDAKQDFPFLAESALLIPGVESGSVCGMSRRHRKICGTPGVQFDRGLDACGMFFRCRIKQAIAEIQAPFVAVVACLPCSNLLLCRLLLPQESILFLLQASLLIELSLLAFHLVVHAIHFPPQPEIVIDPKTAIGGVVTARITESWVPGLGGR